MTIIDGFLLGDLSFPFIVCSTVECAVVFIVNSFVQHNLDERVCRAYLEVNLEHVDCRSIAMYGV